MFAFPFISLIFYNINASLDFPLYIESIYLILSSLRNVVYYELPFIDWL